MSAKEFKAWLEGFQEAMGGPPNKEQWKKILKKLQSVYDECSHGYPWVWYSTPTWTTPNWRTTTADSAVSPIRKDWIVSSDASGTITV